MFGDVRRHAGQFEVGAVDHGAFAAALLRANQVLEALPVQPTAIVLLACRGEDGQGERRADGGEKYGSDIAERMEYREKESQVKEQRQERWREKDIRGRHKKKSRC